MLKRLCLPKIENGKLNLLYDAWPAIVLGTVTVCMLPFGSL
jgi:hypothetical protein